MKQKNKYKEKTYYIWKCYVILHENHPYLIYDIPEILKIRY